MARSTYIYVVVSGNPLSPDVRSAFTVKKEMFASLLRQNVCPSKIWIYRCSDGDRDPTLPYIDDTLLDEYSKLWEERKKA